MALLLRYRSLVIIGIAESVSGFGTWISIMAVIALLMFQDRGGVLQSSGIMVAGLVPMMVVSPLTGRLSDILDRRLVMIGSELASGLVVTAMILTTRLEFLYVLMGILSVVSSAMTPARQAVIPSLVTDENLPKANAFLQQLASVIKIIGPFLAGILLSVLAPRTAMIVDVVSYLLSAAILSRLPALLPEHSGEDREASRQRKSWRASFQVVGGIPLLRLVFVTVFFLVVILIGLDILAPIYVRDVLGRDVGFLGVLIGLVGVGSIITALFLMLRNNKANPWVDVFVGEALLIFLPLSLGLGTLAGNRTAASAMVILGHFIGGIGNGLVIIQGTTLLQTLAPRQSLGGVSGLFQSTMIAGQLVTIVAAPFLVPRIISMGTFFLAGTAIQAIILAGGVLGFRAAMRQSAPPDSSASIEAGNEQGAIGPLTSDTQ